MVELLKLRPRPCVVAEVRSNLTADGRKDLLERFSNPCFKKIAVVAIGEPPDIIKKRAAQSNVQENGTVKFQHWFCKRETPDMPQQELNLTFTSFSLPSMEEGFDEVRYDWQSSEKAEDHLQRWIKHCKLTQCIEDLEPSKWFQTKWAAWQKAYKEWEKKQAEWKSIIEVLGQWKKDGGDEARDGKHTDTDPYELDVFAVKDINDIGEGEPIFANFEYEDWCLLSLRYEAHLLPHAFRHDVSTTDPDRQGFLEKNFGHYYELYYKKAFHLEVFNRSSLQEVLEFVSDSARVNTETSFVESVLDADKLPEHFMRITEDHRRDRLRRTDAGDETAILKFSKPCPPGAKQVKPVPPAPDLEKKRAVPTGPSKTAQGTNGARALALAERYSRALSTKQPVKTETSPKVPLPAQRRPVRTLALNRGVVRAGSGSQPSRIAGAAQSTSAARGNGALNRGVARLASGSQPSRSAVPAQPSRVADRGGSRNSSQPPSSRLTFGGSSLRGASDGRSSQGPTPSRQLVGGSRGSAVRPDSSRGSAQAIGSRDSFGGSSASSRPPAAAMGYGQPYAGSQRESTARSFSQQPPTGSSSGQPPRRDASHASHDGRTRYGPKGSPKGGPEKRLVPRPPSEPPPKQARTSGGYGGSSYSSAGYTSGSGDSYGGGGRDGHSRTSGYSS